MRFVVSLVLLWLVSSFSFGQQAYFTDTVSHYLLVLQKGDWVKYKKQHAKMFFRKDIREGIVFDINDSALTLIEVKSAFHRKKTDTLSIVWTDLQGIARVNFLSHTGFKITHALVWSGASVATIIVLGGTWPVIVGSLLIYEPLSYFSYRLFDQCFFPLYKLNYAGGRWKKVSIHDLQKAGRWK
jgi:hypothetical protein